MLRSINRKHLKLLGLLRVWLTVGLSACSARVTAIIPKGLIIEAVSNQESFVVFAARHGEIAIAPSDGSSSIFYTSPCQEPDQVRFASKQMAYFRLLKILRIIPTILR